LFGSSPKISLADTLKNQKLILGITKDRKFGGRIDQILENHKGGNIYDG
ncbi:MAG: ABC transporter substrate-binding protein, partial [Desulfobacteraceae bacterium]|nr:ABC transporter substrate-binding protein [Desulfobacteraceae bacterium]